MNGRSMIWMNGAITIFCAAVPELVNFCRDVILRRRKSILYLCGEKSEILHRFDYHGGGISVWSVQDMPELFEALESSVHSTIIFENFGSIYRDEPESAVYIGQALRELTPDATKFVLTREWDTAMDGIRIYADQVRICGRHGIRHDYRTGRAMSLAEQTTLSVAPHDRCRPAGT